MWFLFPSSRHLVRLFLGGAATFKTAAFLGRDPRQQVWFFLITYLFFYYAARLLRGVLNRIVRWSLASGR